MRALRGSTAIIICIIILRYVYTLLLKLHKSTIDLSSLFLFCTIGTDNKGDVEWLLKTPLALSSWTFFKMSNVITFELWTGLALCQHGDGIYKKQCIHQSI